jgi:ribonucleoside-diphosphate reductase alpha chain
MPDAVARALEIHLETLQETAKPDSETEVAPREPLTSANGHSQHGENEQLAMLKTTGNLCPECGCNTLVNEEGCRKCYNCGHSEC